MPDTIPQTETILKSYFENGDQPQENEFRELIGTMFYLFTQAIAAADAANANATAALDRAPKAMLKRVAGVNYGTLNIDTVTNPSGNLRRVTWTTPFLNADYKLSITPIEQPASNIGLIVVIAAQTTTYVEFSTNHVNGTGAALYDFHLIAFA